MYLTKTALLAAAVAVLMSAPAAHAENAAPAAPAGAEKEAIKPEDFAARKAKVLEHMAKREAEGQKRKACVEAATTPEALKACFPNRGHWGKKGPRGEGFPGKEGKGFMKEDGGDTPPAPAE